MRKIYTIFLVIFLLGSASIKAQSTDGTDFWVTFGRNARAAGNPELRIRIVSRGQGASGTIHFTQQTPPIPDIPFSLGPYEVFTTNPLNSTQISAVYHNLVIGSETNFKTIYIHSDQPITAYAMNQYEQSTDATNLLPETALDAEYYQISYISKDYSDAYAVIAMENGTKVYHDGILAATLDRGEVYYKTYMTPYPADMTGAHITTDDNKPIAFFALNMDVYLPHTYPDQGTSRDCFMQQLAPVGTWGKKFFVPVSDLTCKPSPSYPSCNCDDTKDRVRIVASQDGTTFTVPPTNITLITNSGGQSPITKTLNKGQFFELEVTLNNNGTYF